MHRLRTGIIWALLAFTVGLPMLAAGFSPQLAWREPVYIVAGFAGIAAMALMVVQPLLAGGYLPGLALAQARKVHLGLGIAIVLAVVVHVGGLWLTSPPDVADALLFVSPTPFSGWGVVAMWAVFGAALMVVLRKRLHLKPRNWRLGHTLLVCIAVGGTVTHALLIEGTMEMLSKVVLCVLLVLAMVKTVVDRRAWASRRASKEPQT